MEKQDNIKYSLVFLNYDPLKEKDWVKETKENVLEKSTQHDDLEFIEVRDVKGYVNAVNEGMKKAKGEYVFILNDDIMVKDREWIEKLAQPNAITSFKKNPFYMNGEMMPDGACWCVHRSVIDTIGYMDEAYGDGYGCDEIDYYYQAQQAGFELLEASADIEHFCNRTYSSRYFARDKEAMTQRNKQIFYDKWKDTLLNLEV